LYGRGKSARDAGGLNAGEANRRIFHCRLGRATLIDVVHNMRYGMSDLHFGCLAVHE